MRLERESETAREEDTVKAATKEPLALITPGPAHHLSDSVRRVGGACEDIRVTTRRVREFAD